MQLAYLKMQSSFCILDIVLGLGLNGETDKCVDGLKERKKRQEIGSRWDGAGAVSEYFSPQGYFA